MKMRWTMEGKDRDQNPFVLQRLCTLKSFSFLTRGTAIFGKPGETCRGPYSVRKFSLEEI